MPVSARATPDDIQMSSVFDALKKSIGRILITSGAVGALTFGVLTQIAPRYQSQAELAIEARGNSSGFSDPKAGASNPDVITTRMDKEAINTHVRALQSPDLITRIADTLKLDTRPEFNAALGPVDMLDATLRMAGIGGPRSGESERDRVQAAFRDRLEVYTAKESRFIGIRFTSIDSELAAEIANKIAETYRESLASQGVSEIDEQQKVIQAKIEKLMPEVAGAETEIERYRGEINVFKGGAQNTGLNEQQLSELTGELTKAKSMRGEAEARSRSAREMMKAGSADALPDVQRSPLIQNLVQQRVRIERQISELSAVLLPAHPRMRQMKADLAGLKTQLSAEIGKLVESLDKEAAVARDREESIKKSLDDVKKRVVNIAPQEAKLRQLETNVRAKRTELENLQTQLEGNRKKLDTRSQPVEAQLISRAQPSSVPIYPKKGSLSALLAIAALFIGLFISITKALFQGARGGSMRSATQSHSAKAGPRAEPELPDAPKPVSAAHGLTETLKRVVNTSASAAETTLPDNMTALIPRLVAARQPEGGHRILITGETTALDPGQEAVMLAEGLASTGAQIILIDWSRTGKGVVSRVGLELVPGMNDLMAGEAGFEEIVQRLPGSTAHVIASGKPLDADGAEIDADQMNLVLDALDEAYDHIVVVSTYGDARYLFETILGRFDAGVVVAEARRRTSVLDDPSGTFLGFEVADIDIVRLERTPVPAVAANAAVAQRITRAIRKTATEARTS